MIVQLLTAVLLLCSSANLLSAGSPHHEPQSENLAGYYVPPLKGELLLSANFAEIRANHLHSGIDIKTGGVTGKPVYAAADGYISRVGVVPQGFGRVLYVTHPNGTTSVYGHLDRFMPDVEAYVTAERYRQHKHRIDLFLEKGRFPVRQGEQIACSGSSGMSFGPHLHFEIRNAASQRPLNVLALGLLPVRDDLPPVIRRLYYIGLDSVCGVPVAAAPVPIEVRRRADGVYEPCDTAVFSVGAKGYFVLQTTDRKNGTAHTMGVYRVTCSLDGRTSLDFSLGGFLFSDTRYVNSLTEYPLQLGSRDELLRLAVQAGNRLPVFGTVRNRGLIALADTAVHTFTLRVEDDSRNVSDLSLKIRKDTGSRPFVPATETTGMRVDPSRPFVDTVGGLTVTIPARSLYEPLFFRAGMAGVSAPKGLRMSYSPVYRVHDARVPLHQAMTVSIEVGPQPAKVARGLCLATVSADGSRCSYAGGRYEAGRVTGKLRAFGNYCVVSDNVPPVITPSFRPGADLRRALSVTFALTDDFSGIASFSGTIDGRWILFEQDVLRKRITHVFDPSRFNYAGGRHTLVLTVTDGAGNSTTFRAEFVR